MAKCDFLGFESSESSGIAGFPEHPWYSDDFLIFFEKLKK